MKNRFGKTTWAAISLLGFFLLTFAFGVAKFSQTAPAFEEENPATSSNNSETLWESITHQLITLAY